jgi:hypothetical protein
VFEGPEDEDRFSIDVFPRHETPGAAVIGGDAMISQDEVVVGRDNLKWIGAVVTVFERDVVLFELFAVDQNVTVSNFDCVARQPDDSFYIGDGIGWIVRIPEHNRVATFDVPQSEFVAELVDEEAFLIEQRWHHAGAFHFDGTVEKKDDKDGDEDREHEVTKPGNDRDQCRTWHRG